MPTQQTTKPSIPKLSEVAKFVHVPPGGVSTGWPAVRDKLADLGIRFRWWQVAIARIILSKNAAGKYTTTIGGVGLSIARQAGKTFLVGALVFALCLLRPGLTVIWSAHRTRTAEETFKKMQAFARRKSIKPFILKVTLGSGEESIEFVNGSRIMFGARADGFGRGFDEVDVVVYDEAQILAQSALDDMIPATNQCRQPEGALMFFMGTPPQEKEINAGKAEVFTLMRESAKQGDEDTAWIEFGADDNYKPTRLPLPLTEHDWQQVARANPSYPDDTPPESVLRMRKKLGDSSFLLEGAGVWPEVVKQFSPFNGPLWRDAADIGPSGAVKPDALAVDMSHDRQISVAACWLEADSAHLEEVWAGVDEPAAVAWVVDAWKRAGRRTVVVIDGQSPASSMIPALKAAGVRVITSSAAEMARACGLTKSDLEAGRLTHADQESVNKAREGSRKRAIGAAGGWGLDRSDSTVNIAPMVASVLARLGASMTKKTKSSTGRRVVTG